MISRKVSRKTATIKQIHCAIELLHKGEFECAITLALAAEDQLAPTNDPHLFKQLRDRVPAEYGMFNEVRNWLKHHLEPEEIVITDFEAVIAIVRAESKFVAVFHEATRQMLEFEDWVKKQGLFGLSEK